MPFSLILVCCLVANVITISCVIPKVKLNVFTKQRYTISVLHYWGQYLAYLCNLVFVLVLNKHICWPVCVCVVCACACVRVCVRGCVRVCVVGVCAVCACVCVCGPEGIFWLSTHTSVHCVNTRTASAPPHLTLAPPMVYHPLKSSVFLCVSFLSSLSVLLYAQRQHQWWWGPWC